MSVLSDLLAQQLRRPSGLLGRWVMPRALDRGNRGLIEATLAHLALAAKSRYLDIGFGGGLALRLASETVTRGQLVGSDFSPDVVAVGHRRMRKLVSGGRLNLVVADIGHMPFRSEHFDRVSTMNTIYFWPDPPAAAAELFRVLERGGRLAIGYTGAEKMAQFPKVSASFTLWQPAAVEALLGAAGFEGVRTTALTQGVTAGDFVTVAAKS